jgi:predicted lysophospholipase L1 biosynthesis ABC-type transport system permease subunit
MSKKMSTHQNTISHTRLLSIIVIVSVIALAFVLDGNQIDNKQNRVINESPDHTAINGTNTLFQKKPVSGTTVNFRPGPDALVLTI